LTAWADSRKLNGMKFEATAFWEHRCKSGMSGLSQ
jgi:hypothetical protein